MKKKILLIGALAVAVGAGYCKVSLQESRERENWLLENVEALASGEVSVPHRCYGVGSIDCPLNRNKVGMVYSGWSLGDSLY